jgi:hypothetical protein
MAATIQALVPRMRDICGAGNVITDPLELRTYECDGLTSHRCVPALVVLPGSAAADASVRNSTAACALASSAWYGWPVPRARSQPWITSSLSQHRTFGR